MLFFDDVSTQSAREDILRSVDAAKAQSPPLRPNQEIKVEFHDEKLVLGRKRQIMATDLAKDYQVLCWWDDDDFYYPDRIQYSVKSLIRDPKLRAVGCSAQQLFFTTLRQVYHVEAMPSPYHATAGTMCMWRRVFDKGNDLEDPPLTFEKDAGFAEERHMLKNFTVPLKQLDITRVMMIICHGGGQLGNTVPKEQLVNRKNLNFKKSTQDFKKMIKVFTKNDKISFEFYTKLVQTCDSTGETERWKKFVYTDKRADVHEIGGKVLDKNSVQYKKLNGLT